MEFEAENEEDAIRKARFALGLNPAIERLRDCLAEGVELCRAICTVAKEGADLAPYKYIQADLRRLLVSLPFDMPKGRYTDNVVDFFGFERRRG